MLIHECDDFPAVSESNNSLRKSNVKPTIAFSSLIGILAVVVTVESRAVDITWKPAAHEMMRLEDNVRGASENKEGAWGFETGAGVDLNAKADWFSSQLHPLVNIRKFAIGDDLDADEYGVKFNNQLIQARSVSGLDFSYNRDSTLATEERNLGETDVGLVNAVKNRDAILVSPRFIYAFSDRLNSETFASYNDVKYQDAQGTGLIDYQYVSASTGLRYQWRDNAELSSRFIVSDFRAPDVDSTTRNYSQEVELTWRWSETFETSGMIGWIQSDVSFSVFEQRLVLIPIPRFIPVKVDRAATRGGPVASANIRKKFDQFSAQLRYDREVSPSGQGQQSSSDRISANAVRPVTDRVSLVLDGIYEMRTSETEGLGAGIAGDLNRDYYEVKASLRYQLKKEWGVSATYRYGHRESTGAGTVFVADMNTFFVIVDYKGVEKKLVDGL
jgi:hypothetical protein